MNTDIVRKILYYDKSFLLWARQTGKTTIIFDYLKNYVQQNKNSDILFFCNDEKICNTKNLLFRNCHSIILNHNEKYINFINKNKLKFCSIRCDNFKYLHYLKPNLIIFDDIFKYVKAMEYLIKYVNCNGDSCKCLLTGTYTDGDLVKSFDCYNDFYINIKKENKKLDFDSKLNDVSLEINFFSYKPIDLLDINDIRYERKKKLIIINELSKKLKENGRKM